MKLENLFKKDVDLENNASACGASDKEEKPSACGTACGASDKK